MEIGYIETNFLINNIIPSTWNNLNFILDVDVFKIKLLDLLIRGSFFRASFKCC